MENQKIHTLKYLKENRSNLRKNLTPAEAKLWTYLKGSKLQNRKFIRQHSIENYIVDFYCASEKLIIELDGQVHFTEDALANDAHRTARLNELGFKVIRFENKLVFQQAEWLLAEIASNFTSSPCEKHDV